MSRNGLSVDAPLPPAVDWKGWVGLGLTIAIALVGVVLWAGTGMASKASEKDVQAIELRVRALEVDQAWIKAALYALTQKAGVIVPPPPTSP